MGTTSRGYRYPSSTDDVRPYEDIQNLATDVNADIANLGTKQVSSGSAGTGVTATETKDASGDLTFTAVSGYTYLVAYEAKAIAGASGHSMDVNVRDGGASSPTNVSTIRAGATVLCGVGGTTPPATAVITKAMNCPGDITAGTHTLAVFYVRNVLGTTSSVVQLENSGPNRVLSVTATPTLA